MIMRNIVLLAAVVLGSSAGLAADELPKADTILDKYIEVTGGKAAYEMNHSEVSTGTMEFVGKGINGSVASYRAEPNKSYTEIDIQGIGKVKEGSDGNVAWSLSAMQGPRVKDGEEKAGAIQAARFNAELNWRDLYKAETTGSETVQGSDCYKVLLTPKEGMAMTRYYDKKSNLLVKMVMTVKNPMGEFPVESLVSDYRKEGAILLPHKVTQKAAGQEITISIDTVKYNAEIPKDKFDPPEEIKAMLKK
jgi:outer membrane lipoprotein-sorting protein